MCQFGNFFERYKIFCTTWHALLHLTRIATHPRTLSRVLPSLARQIACHGVNRLSCHSRLAGAQTTKRNIWQPCLMQAQQKWTELVRHKIEYIFGKRYVLTYGSQTWTIWGEKEAKIDYKHNMIIDMRFEQWRKRRKRGGGAKNNWRFLELSRRC